MQRKHQQSPSIEQLFDRLEKAYRDNTRAYRDALSLLIETIKTQNLNIVLIGYNNIDGIGDYKNLVDYYEWVKTLFAEFDVNIKAIAFAEPKKYNILKIVSPKSAAIATDQDEVMNTESDILIYECGPGYDPLNDDYYQALISKNGDLKKIIGNADFILGVAAPIPFDIKPHTKPTALIHTRLEYASEMAIPHNIDYTYDSMGIGPGFSGIKVNHYQSTIRQNDGVYRACGYLQSEEGCNDLIEIVLKTAQDKNKIEIITPFLFDEARLIDLAKAHGISKIIFDNHENSKTIITDDDPNGRQLKIVQFRGLSNQAILAYQQKSDIIFGSGDNSFSEWVASGGIPLLRLPRHKIAFIKIILGTIKNNFGDDQPIYKLFEELTKPKRGSDKQTNSTDAICKIISKNKTRLIEQLNTFRAYIHEHENAYNHLLDLTEIFLLKTGMELKAKPDFEALLSARAKLSKSTTQRLEYMNLAYLAVVTNRFDIFSQTINRDILATGVTLQIGLGSTQSKREKLTWHELAIKHQASIDFIQYIMKNEMLAEPDMIKFLDLVFEYKRMDVLNILESHQLDMYIKNKLAKYKITIQDTKNIAQQLIDSENWLLKTNTEILSLLILCPATLTKDKVDLSCFFDWIKQQALASAGSCREILKDKNTLASLIKLDINLLITTVFSLNNYTITRILDNKALLNVLKNPKEALDISATRIMTNALSKNIEYRESYIPTFVWLIGKNKERLIALVNFINKEQINAKFPATRGKPEATLLDKAVSLLKTYRDKNIAGQVIIKLIEKGAEITALARVTRDDLEAITDIGIRERITKSSPELQRKMS